MMDLEKFGLAMQNEIRCGQDLIVNNNGNSGSGASGNCLQHGSALSAAEPNFLHTVHQSDTHSSNYLLW